jgi:hypothetical protein
VIWCCACCRSKRASTQLTACARYLSATRSQIRFHSILTARGAPRTADLSGRERSSRSCRAVAASEVERLGADFAGAAAWIAATTCRGAVHCADGDTRGAPRYLSARRAALPRIRLIDGGAREALAACNVALVASGTATLETLLSQRPMVVAYRLAAATVFVARTARAGEVALHGAAQSPRRPSFGAGVFSGRGHPAGLGGALLRELDDPARARASGAEFRRMHVELRCGAAERAAQAILECAGIRRMTPASLALRRARIAGVDEAGRGPLAGPVVAAAVILNARRPIAGLADSKTLPPEERDGLPPDSHSRARLGHRLVRFGGDRQPQHPAGDVARDASRAPVPAALSHSRAGGRRSPAAPGGSPRRLHG